MDESGGPASVGEKPAADVGNTGVGKEFPEPRNDRMFVKAEFLHVGRMTDEHLEHPAANDACLRSSPEGIGRGLVPGDRHRGGRLLTVVPGTGHQSSHHPPNGERIGGGVWTAIRHSGHHVRCFVSRLLAA